MRTPFVALALAVIAASISTAPAQPYPSRPITMVVPFSAGGPTDTLARIIADRMRAALGRPWWSGTGAQTIAVRRVARAAPDGYTLSIGNWGSHVANGAILALPYDLLKDFEPVAMLASNPQLIVSKNAVPAKDLKELIAWVKANQDKVSAGTAGIGASSHSVLPQNITGPFRSFRMRHRTGCRIWWRVIST
jgi:tripartite-type tricarboxylate transporter receptor subunit TctC